MPITVKTSFGTVQFPDGMDQKTMKEAIDKHMDFMKSSAEKEALAPPDVNPVDVAQMIVSPEAMLSKPAKILAGKLTSRIAAGVGTGVQEKIQAWLDNHDPSHPYWNTALGLLSGIMAGKGASKLVPGRKTLPEVPAGIPPASSLPALPERPITVPSGGFPKETPPIPSPEFRTETGPGLGVGPLLQEKIATWKRANGSEKDTALNDLLTFMRERNLKPEPSVVPKALPKPPLMLEEKKIAVPPGGFKPPYQPKQPGSYTFQSTLFPGAKEFFDQDIAPLAQHSRRSWDHLKAMLAPQTRGEIAQKTAGLLRSHLGQAAMESERAYAPVESVRKYFSQNPVQVSHEFIHKIETGEKTGNPYLDEAAASMRETLDSRWGKLNNLGLLDSYIENYFPHLYKDPAYADSSLQRYMGKRPWEGTKTFTKQRYYGTLQEAMAAGQELASNNPVELFLSSVTDMNRLIHAREAWNTLKEEGLVRFVKIGDRPPTGWSKISDRIGKVLRVVPEVGVVHSGDYYLPDEAAQVLENHLSKGLAGNPIYDSVRMAANGMNAFQLGLSAFHFTFVSGDSALASISLGLRELSQGRSLLAISKILRGFATLPATVGTFRKGSALSKAYLSGKNLSPEMEKMVKAVTEAGGRIHIDPIYRNPTFESVMSRLKSGNYPGAILHLPFAFIGAISKPLFEVYVPRMKLGVFYQMAQSEMEQHPGASMEELRPLLQKAWDSVDNRMGMMVYDNLFWNKMFKDSAMISTRSVGWNLGTIRELGGGVKDIPSSVMEKELSHRLSYTLALPIYTAWLGGLYYYAKHGTAPQTLFDYFYPPTGEKRADGSDVRVAIPTYMKDVFSYSHSVPGTLANKLNPLWESLYEMMQNKDFYGDQIVNPNDPLVQRVKERANYMFGTFEPFSIRNLLQRQGQPGAGPESFLGFTVAPHAIGETPAEQLLHQVKSSQGSFTLTPEQAAKRQEKRKILGEIRNRQEYLPELRTDLQQGKLSLEDAKRILAESRRTPLQNGIMSLGAYDALLIYDKANSRERKQILPLLWKKLSRWNQMSGEEKAKILPLLHRLFPPSQKKGG